jgi:hypothetical protein
MKAKISIFLFPLLLYSGLAEASSFAFRIGPFALKGESDLWADNVATFNVEVDDFNYVFGGGEFTFELSEFADFAMGVDIYSRRVSTHYRELVRDDGTEVRQDMKLSVIPVTAGVRFMPIGKFHVVFPYVAGGFGLYAYEYVEEGEYIDFATWDIFAARFQDNGVGFGGYAAAGLEARVSQGFSVFGEYRRHWVLAQHGGDFRDYGDFDLDATQIAFGFVFRF